MKIVKKILLTLLISTMSLLFVFNRLSSQQTTGELFEKAFYLEEAKGDLQKAIDLYQNILERFPENREIAAKAQLHIGLCYEKLGLKEAPKTYQKVVDEYPEQKEAVKVAKEKLSVLLKVIRKGDIEFALRKIGPGIETGLGAISPDGRYLTYVDWNTGDLMVQEMATGKKRHLTDKGSWNKSGAQAFCSRWSPDGKQIAYDWWDWDREPNFIGIHIVSLDGKESQTLYQVTNPEKGETITYGWSPDGKYLAYISIRDSLGPKSSTQSVLCIRSLDTGEERELFPDLPDFWGLKWSPDSRYILCIAVDSKDRSAHSVLCLIDTRTGKVMPVVKCENNRLNQWFQSHDWSHDGNSIFYVCNDKPDKLCQLLVWDLEGGKEKEIYRAPLLG